MKQNDKFQMKHLNFRLKKKIKRFCLQFRFFCGLAIEIQRLKNKEAHFQQNKFFFPKIKTVTFTQSLLSGTISETPNEDIWENFKNYWFWTYLPIFGQNPKLTLLPISENPRKKSKVLILDSKVTQLPHFGHLKNVRQKSKTVIFNECLMSAIRYNFRKI